jgi:hypothetical protein
MRAGPHDLPAAAHGSTPYAAQCSGRDARTHREGQNLARRARPASRPHSIRGAASGSGFDAALRRSAIAELAVAGEVFPAHFCHAPRALMPIGFLAP